MGIQSDEHTRAMTLLLQAVLGQPVGPTDEEAAKLHVARCEVCWPRFKQLAEVLMGEPVSFKSDSEAGKLFAAPTFGERWRLQRSAPTITERPGRWHRGDGYLGRLTEEVRQRTTALLISVRQFWAGTNLLLAPVHRGSGEITLRCADLPGLETTVAITSDNTDPALVRVMVEVSMPARWPDFSGVRVILDDGVQQVERVTGRAGRVEFERIATEKVPDLNLIVLPPIEDSV